MDHDKLKERLQEALDHAGNLYSIEDIADRIHKGEMQCFESEDGNGFMMTEIAEFPRRKVLFLTLCVGDMAGRKNATELYNRVLAFAREKDCADIRVEGRVGWEKFLPALGWKKAGVSYRLDL